MSKTEKEMLFDSAGVAFLGERYYVTFAPQLHLSSLTLVHTAHRVECFVNIFAPRCSMDIRRP